MVVVDPYLSDTAVKAQEWVAIRPATDGALALALAHVIIREGLYDKDFVKHWTVGFEEYAAYVKDNPVSPEDFGATLLHALGVPLETRLAPDGATYPASPGQPITDLFG